jgi:multicomponent Na+:H+ antiporter subunit B
MEMKMSPIVRKSAKLVSPFLVTYGAYLIVHGHISPGGGFQGGVILAVSVILLITSYGYTLVEKKFSITMVQVLESLSLLFLLLVAVSGLAAGFFFYNYLRGGVPGTLFSGGTVVWLNILIGFEVGAAFTLLFYVLLRGAESD